MHLDALAAAEWIAKKKSYHLLCQMPKADPSAGVRRWLQPAVGSESSHSGEKYALVNCYRHMN